MKNIRSEKGFTGIDIGISVIIIFVLAITVATIIANYNSKATELKLKSEAIYIASREIEIVKGKGFLEYEGMNKDTTVDSNNDSLINQPINR